MPLPFSREAEWLKKLALVADYISVRLPAPYAYTRAKREAGFMHTVLAPYLHHTCTGLHRIAPYLQRTLLWARFQFRFWF